MKKPSLAPYPKKLILGKGSFIFKQGDCLLLPRHDKDKLYLTAKRLIGVVWDLLHLKLALMVENQGMYRTAIVFERDATLTSEEYKLVIVREGIRINYHSDEAAFHAVSTLKQLFTQYGRILPCLTIEDSPDFKARGIMLDISRNKIPTMETLYGLIDFMADFKLNQLQLYIEGFAFAYPTYPFVWQDGTPITGEEIMALDQYCRERYIDLVPNQNSLGHMGAWLARPEFNALAECPEGFEAPWVKNGLEKPGTLNPNDARSVQFVEHISDDLLSYFTSSLFNMGGDEPFELGMGKSKERCERLGKGRVYLDFLLQLYQIASGHGKRMMFWGDVIKSYPELIGELPKGIIAMEWGYEADSPFEANGAKYREAGIDFYVCPGTSSWNAICGRTEKMKANLLNAAINGKKHGAVGYLNTDWGDNGHWQYISFSYPAFVYGAALCWHVENNVGLDISAVLDQFIFYDKNRIAGQLILDLGQYSIKDHMFETDEYAVNSTLIARTLFVGLEETTDTEVANALSTYPFSEIKKNTHGIMAKLDEASISCKDANQVEAEMRNAVALVSHGCDLGILKQYARDSSPDKEVYQLLERMIREISLIIRNHENLWLLRNRHGGLTSSVNQLNKLKEQYISLLNDIKINEIQPNCRNNSRCV